MINLGIKKKIDLFSARNCAEPEPFRSIASRLSINKSSLHYMLKRVSEEVRETLEPPKESAKQFLVQVVLVLSLVGRMSSRPVADAISLIFGKSISHDTVLEILRHASYIARDVNRNITDLSDVKEASFDEIFQSNKPILAFVDNKSGVIMLRPTKDRSSESWDEFIKSLKELGLQPSSVITDGGKGLKKGLSMNFGTSVIYVLDLFHVVTKLLKAKKKMEGICYSLLNALDNLVNSGIDKRTSKYLKLNSKVILAIDNFDKYEALLKKVQQHVYLADKETNQYVTSEMLKNELIEIASYLKTFYQEVRKHKAINSARSYVDNNIPEIIAYKANIEKKIYNHYHELAPMVFNYILPIVEYHDRYERSYENTKAQKYWIEKILKTKDLLLEKENISEEFVNNIINEVYKIVSKFAKSNSLIENVNNQIRRFLDTYKSIPSPFCELFSFYWNFRKFKRGKRNDFAPIELLSQSKLKKTWLDIILDQFPYDKIRSSLELR